jgi:hypothetical protein
MMVVMMMMLLLPAFCASLRSRNAHGHVTTGILRRNVQGKMPYAHPASNILCEPALSNCTWT